MMKKLSLALLFSGLIAKPVAAEEALSAEARADLECAALVSIMSSQNDKGPPPASVQATIAYFIGKVRGRHPGIDIKQHFTREVFASAFVNAEAAKERCSTDAIEIGEALESAGEAIKNPPK